MKKWISIVLAIVILAGGWWAFDRYVANLSPSDELTRMVSAARMGDDAGFVSGFTEESGKIISALLSLSRNFGHVRTHPVERIAEAEIVDETIEGDRAKVLIQHRNKTREIPMIWTDRGWKVDAFAMDASWK